MTKIDFSPRLRAPNPDPNGTVTSGARGGEAVWLPGGCEATKRFMPQCLRAVQDQTLICETLLEPFLNYAFFLTATSITWQVCKILQVWKFLFTSLHPLFWDGSVLLCASLCFFFMLLWCFSSGTGGLDVMKASRDMASLLRRCTCTQNV